MKRFVLLLFITFSVTSCQCYKYKRANFDYNISENPWILAFKDATFYECLKEGYKNDSIYILMSREDLFNPYDGIEFSAIDSARMLGKKIILNMPKPIFCDDCDETGKNYISANCLHYYASEELDSIARAAYKQHLANQ